MIVISSKLYPKRTTTPQVNRRYVAAIQKYSLFWEERAGFTVDSPIVKKALADAKNCSVKYHSRSNEHVDAHKHRPTRHPSPTQELSMIEFALNDHRQTKNGYLPKGMNFLISWNCAMQAFTRGDEVRSCRLPDLCHETNYGPWRLSDTGGMNVCDDSSPSGIISIIQQPFCTKINSPKAHAVGFFRHRDWRRCATSMIAFSLMARFEYMNHTQLDSLFSVGPNGVPLWYNYFLIDWRSYSSMADAFKEYFNAADIQYTKLTHVRKLGIIRAHQLGADRENIILLSKHTTHKVDTSYLPELPYNALLACAGFDVFRRQEYYIPRSYAQVPTAWHGRIFPYLQRWQSQVNDMREYDKGMSAKTFVNYILPHMAQIIIQDGIYFVDAYPNHPYSVILMHKMQSAGYEQWANNVRAMINTRVATVPINVAEDRRYDAVLRTSEHTAHRVLSVEQRIDSLTAELRQLCHYLRHQRAVTHSSDALSYTSCTNIASPTRLSGTHLQSSPYRYESELSSPTREQRRVLSVEPVPSSTTCLRSSRPIIPPNIHKTIKDNIEHWLFNRHWEFLCRGDVSLRQLGWDSKAQHRFCKRRDIAQWVKVVAENYMETDIHWEADGEILLQVAAIMDEERGSKTVNKALNDFKANNALSWKKCRKKKH